ncbi:MAG: LPS export ABC transporter periplasmic protein LptC [Culturomica sp.]|jgi:hypothetical protein|nr:LPS export ABC transporter periplasmic protein LptC [Culturomica sp.]
MAFGSKIGLGKGIITLLGVIMLFACKNDLNKVKSLTEQSELHEMEGEELVLIYSDSARIKYKILTPLYYKVHTETEQYDEFPRGIHVVTYDTAGNVVADIRSKYAKELKEEKLWEARNQVVVTNADGTKLETELMYWDMANRRIYSDRYSRLTAQGNILESSDGFESDDKLERPVFKNITDGRVEVEL